jgi:hypothetical protein
VKKALLIIVTAITVLLIFGARARLAGAATPGPTYDASSYGAVCDGTLRSTTNGGSVDGDAIQKAINAAEAGAQTGTVVLPSGTCMISHSLSLLHGNGIIITGAQSSTGSPMTTITNSVNPAYGGGDLEINTNNNTVENVVLDQSNYGGTAIVKGNYNTLQNMNILGGKTFFVLYFTTTSSGAHAVGNQLLDSTVVSLINRQVAGGPNPYDDGISWSEQDHSLIQNVQFTGTRLALYQDNYTTVNGYTYYPGPQTGGLDGFYVTQPSSNLTLENLTMYGSAGVVSNGSTTNGTTSNVTITNEQVKPPTAGAGFTLNGPSHGLQIRNVNGLVINQSNLDSSNPQNSNIQFAPTTSAQGVTVENTTVPRVNFACQPPAGSTAPGTVSGAAFNSDTFTAYTGSGAADTFVNWNGGSPSFQVSGGNWYNTTGGFLKGSATYSVTTLGGYNAPLTAPAPA